MMNGYLSSSSADVGKLNNHQQILQEKNTAIHSSNVNGLVKNKDNCFTHDGDDIHKNSKMKVNGENGMKVSNNVDRIDNNQKEKLTDNSDMHGDKKINDNGKMIEATTLSADQADLSEDANGIKDRYGFLLSDEHHQFLHQTEETKKNRLKKENERSKKWIKMLGNWNKYVNDKDLKLRNRIRKGIPDAVRSKAWYLLCGAPDVQSKYPNLDALEIDSVDPRTVDEIERDIDRTFPRHIQFMDATGFGQASLRKLLQQYALLDPGVGYCQGMGFVAGLFLTYMIEDQAFYCFYATMNNPLAPLRALYLPRLAETKKMLYVYEELGKQFLGDLWVHLEHEGVHPTMFVTEWIMTMFCRGFSFDLVTRVWDIFLNEHSFKIVYRVSLALLKNIESQLKIAKFDRIMGLIKEMPQNVDAESLMQVVWAIPLKHEHIEKIEKEYLATLPK